MAASPEGMARIPAIPVTLADTVGAGDSFGAALLAALTDRYAIEPDTERPLDNSLLEEAVTYAIAASAITCTRTGAVPPSRAEIDAWIALVPG
jgi:fructokinase